MSEVISAFLNDRKTDWLKKQIKSEMSAEERLQLEQAGEIKYSLATWLPEASGRAKQLSMASHPGKYSHPNAKSSSIIASGIGRAQDGYLRTGNVVYDLDVFGNAAALDVQKFLSLQLENGQTILEHLEKNSLEIQEAFALENNEFIKVRHGFLAVKKSDASQITDGLLKQVYFPVNKDYHLLSLLSPSGLLCKVKATLDEVRFGDLAKQAKENKKKEIHHHEGYDDLYDLTVISYGGTKPQNISVLNTQNGGRAYLLPSKPPALKVRKIRLPTSNFFVNSLSGTKFKESFLHLHKLMQTPINNVHIRQGIENLLNYIIDRVLEHAFMIRASAESWSTAEHYQNLPLEQRIWLDDVHKTQRENGTEWVDSVANSFARWIIHTYEKALKDNKLALGDGELAQVKSFVEQAMSKDKEFLI